MLRRFLGQCYSVTLEFELDLRDHRLDIVGTVVCLEHESVTLRIRAMFKKFDVTRSSRVLTITRKYCTLIMS